MQKLSNQSKDISQENIKKVEELFPNCVTETYDKDGNLVRSIDFDILRQDLSDHVVEGPKERYQFNWPGKREAILLANAPTTNTLRPLPEKSVDFENTKNVYIEGDNLEALKILRETYMGKIKMIYIDPPYNTGNDFVYKDNFKQSTEDYLKSSGDIDEEGNRMEVNGESNGRFHTNWLNMMYPRLVLARDLLMDDGVIFTSIDDNEVDNLKKLFDEVFGNANFVAIINWRGRGGRQDSKYFAAVHEYILCYAKNKQFFSAGEEIKQDDVYPKYDSQKGKFYKTQLLRKWGSNSRREDRPNLFYPIKAPDGSDLYPLIVEKDPQSPSNNKILDGCWRHGANTMAENIKNGLVEFQKQPDGRWVAYEKIYAPDEGEEKTKKYTTWIDETNNGAKEIKSLFGKAVFDYPKSTSLIEHFLKMGNVEEGDLVLDFFSGSATTADAVFHFENDNNQRVSFVLIQFPENCDVNSVAASEGFKTICDIGEERIRRSGEMIKESNPLTCQNMDTGFRVYQIDSSNMKDMLSTPKETQLSLLENAESAIKSDRNPLDLVTQVMLQLGITLDADIKIGKFAGGGQFYAVNGNDLVCCFDKNISESDIEELARMQPLNVAFRDDSFTSDQDEVNCEQIFKTLSPITGKNIFVL